MKKHSKEENKVWSKLLMQAMRGKTSSPAYDWYQDYVELQSRKDKILAKYLSSDDMKNENGTLLVSVNI